MVEIHLSDRLGHVTSKKMGFSWLHFFFGPFYSIAKLHILFGILELLAIYLLIPIPGLEYVSKGIVQLANSIFTSVPDSLGSNIDRFLLFFRRQNRWIISSFMVACVHVYISYYVKGFFLRREMKKKQLRPVEEKDARLLIQYHVTNTNVALAESFDLRQSSGYKSAEENWYENNQMRLKGERATKFMTRSTILFAGEKSNFGKKKQPGTQTIEIEAWNDNSFGSIDEAKTKKAIGDDEFSNFTDYSKFVKPEEKEKTQELLTEPIKFDSYKTDTTEIKTPTQKTVKFSSSSSDDDLLYK